MFFRFTRQNAPVLIIAAIAALAGGSAFAADGKKKEEAPKFIRLVREGGDPVAMETAIARYRLPNGETVDLIGAVHVGDREYYEKLNERFKQYDVLLYELVAPEGTRVPKGGGGGSSHPIALIQGGMKEALRLTHQMEHIDYHAKNFVHADMSPDDFDKSMSDRGESWGTMFFRMMGQGIAMQTKATQRGSDAAMIAALLQSILGDPEGAVALKRQMAQQFEDLESAMGAFDGPNGSAIITERNKRALDVLAEQLKTDKKSFGVFYGAGHLPDMDRRLLKDFGAKRVSTEWVRAWDLTSVDVSAPAKEAEKAKPKAKSKKRKKAA